MTKNLVSVDARGLKSLSPVDSTILFYNQNGHVNPLTGVMNLPGSGGFTRGSYTFDAYPYFSAGRTLNFEIEGSILPADAATQYIQFGLNLYGSASLATESRQFAIGYPDSVSVYAFRMRGRVWHATISGANTLFASVESLVYPNDPQTGIAITDFRKSGASISLSNPFEITIGAKANIPGIAPDDITVNLFRIWSDL